MWWTWVLAIVIVLLPLLLMAVFNRGELADSRGRRLSRRWRVHG